MTRWPNDAAPSFCNFDDENVFHLFQVDSFILEDHDDEDEDDEDDEEESDDDDDDKSLNVDSGEEEDDEDDEEDDEEDDSVDPVSNHRHHLVSIQGSFTEREGSVLLTLLKFVLSRMYILNIKNS